MNSTAGKPIVALILSLSLATGAGLTTAAPEQAGFSKDRLSRINMVMKDHVQAGRLAGASGLIARDGKIVFQENWGELKPDTIVRMYSMTKGVTGVAAMMLYEEGKFAMTDPVSKYMPEFTHMKVGREMTDTTGKPVYYAAAAEHAITVRD